MPIDSDPERPDNEPRSRADLFWSFAWLALQGFGGVLAVVQRELVEKKRWLTDRQFVEDWAVAQILPGPNTVNLAIMLGSRHFGIGGVLAALGGMLLMPALLTLVIVVGYSTMVDAPVIQQVLRGIGAVAAGMILGTGLKLLAALRFNAMGTTLCALLVGATLVATAVLRLPLVLVLAVLGTGACLWAAFCLHRAAARAAAQAEAEGASLDEPRAGASAAPPDADHP